MIVPTVARDGEDGVTRLSLPGAIKAEDVGRVLKALETVIPGLNDGDRLTIQALLNEGSDELPNLEERERERRAILDGLAKVAPTGQTQEVKIHNLAPEPGDKLSDIVHKPALTRKFIRTYAAARATVKGFGHLLTYYVAGVLRWDDAVIYMVTLALADSTVEYYSSRYCTEFGNAAARGVTCELQNPLLRALNWIYSRGGTKTQFIRGAATTLVVFAIGRNAFLQYYNSFFMDQIHPPAGADYWMYLWKGSIGVLTYTIAHFAFEAAKKKGTMTESKTEIRKREIAFVDPVIDLLNIGAWRAYAPIIQVPQWITYTLVPLFLHRIKPVKHIVLMEQSVGKDPTALQDAQSIGLFKLDEQVPLTDADKINRVLNEHRNEAFPVTPAQAEGADAYAVERSLTDKLGADAAKTKPDAPKKLKERSCPELVEDAVTAYGVTEILVTKDNSETHK